jgi:histidinol-phosphate aminotransferase
MSLSRRHFFRNLGLGGAGLMSTPFIIGRGHEAMAFEAGVLQPPDDNGFIRISSNENARGPGRKTMDALRNTITPRVGRGYPPDYTGDLVGTIAETYGVGRDHVIIGTGSGPILEGAARAFCSAQKPLVTAAPTYATSEQGARRVGAPVKLIAVDKSLALDTEAMAEAAKGAGMIFFCNPNNPTGTVHNAAAVEKFVRRVKQTSPDTRILIDEAYIDYVHDPGVKTAAPLAKELPGVFITRSFSKAHGMAGLRLGYAIGQPETLKAISAAWSLGSVNTLTAAAGIASLRDSKHIEEERAENARVRDFTLQAFRDMG